MIAGLLLALSAPDPEVYILAGQSNMSGRGALADLTAAERTPDPAIRVLGNDGRVRVAAEPLDDAMGQVDAVSADKAAAVGPGMAFARELRRLRGRDILLIPCAKGGVSIRRWQPAGGRDTLYGSCLARARQAGHKVTGILWYQGESDAESVDRSAAWVDAFKALVASWRQDLGDPELPVVFVQLSDPPPADGQPYPGWATVQASQARAAIACTAMVPAIGLPQNPDRLHLATAGQRTLGRKLATAMQGLLKQDCRR